MKRTRRNRWLALGLCLCLMAGLTACGEETAEDKTEFQQALEAIEQEDYQAAYTLLKASKDRRAAEELEKFVFVPVKMTRKDSDGIDESYIYTYDDLGNLLTFKSTDPTGDILRKYTYSGYKKTSYWSQSKAYTYGYTYTYDAAGNLVMERFLDRNGDWLGQTTYTYDDQGNCLSEETARMNEAQDLFPGLETTRYYTYDAKGRMLTEKVSDYYDNELVGYTATEYTYEADGSYRKVNTIDEGDPDLVRTHTAYYDAQGREVRGEWQFHNEDEPYVNYEYQYDDKGNKTYSYHRSHKVEEVTTRTYDDRGNLLEQKVTNPAGDLLSLTVNEYDQQGNLLTADVVYAETNEWRKEAYTYDQHNRVLTYKRSSDNGWEDITYTYDEQGNKITETKEGNRSSYTITYEYDAWGNVVRYFKYETYVSGIENADEQTARWELRYYPNGIPEEVQMVIDEVSAVE